MKIVNFLANKVRNTKNQAFSSTVIKVGIASVAIGVAVILLSFSVLNGFKDKIKEKLFSISAHLQVSKITLNQSFEENPFVFNSEIRQICKENQNISAFNTVIQKSAILKSSTEIGGILLKGIDKDYNWRFFEENIIEGRKIVYKDATYSNEIIISKQMANTLACGIGDDVLLYFIQNPPRARKVKIVGIYLTGVQEIDASYCLADMNLIRRINNWQQNEIGHVEIFLKDFEKQNETQKQLYENLPQELKLNSILNTYAQFFDWFKLLDRNILIVIILIIAVAGFNMISVLLIMIMERSPMIGLLKSLGMSNGGIKKIFFTNALQIILKGLPIGNLLAIVFGLIQYHFKVIPLDPENYYMSHVPISWNFGIWLGVNVGVLILVALFVLVPILLISNIRPVDALKYKD